MACGCHKLYVFWRLFWAVYHFAWIILTGVYSYQWAGYDPSQQVKWFIYLTYWAYFVLTLSTIIDAICVVYISIKRDDILQDISPIMPWYLKVDWVFFNVSNTISILISIMYWGLIYTGSEELTSVNIETHALNIVYIIINFFMTGIPVRFYHFLHPIVFGIIYIVFSVIYEASGGTNHQNKTHIYSVLDWSDTVHTSMIALLIVFVAIPICHFTLFLLHLIRLFMNKQCCSRHKRSCTIVTPEHKSFGLDNNMELNHNNEVKVNVYTNGEGNNTEHLTSNNQSQTLVDSNYQTMIDDSLKTDIVSMRTWDEESFDTFDTEDETENEEEDETDKGGGTDETRDTKINCEIPKKETIIETEDLLERETCDDILHIRETCDDVLHIRENCNVVPHIRETCDDVLCIKETSNDKLPIIDNKKGGEEIVDEENNIRTDVHIC
ncbi:uncharacterized protein LOC127721544 [Mytilus californianus]|uniref:uncharacterized protein LOC127721544 n=1 Tax=Mytilus californianus TaxID=6549 RepID=UPI0022465427|nr:uncharacterized protein LOC127721544 [Mytilus californianus]